MSGDVRAPGEKVWHVSEVSGHGYNRRQHGHTRVFYALSRKHAKEQFVQAGYKQFGSSRLTAVSEGDNS